MLRKMKDNKAPGSANIPKECLKALNKVGIEYLSKLCSKIYETGCFPEDNEKVGICHLTKENQANQLHGFRYQQPLNSHNKIGVGNRFHKNKYKINTEVSEEQPGFKQNSGTTEAIFTFRNVTESYINKGKGHLRMFYRLCQSI